MSKPSPQLINFSSGAHWYSKDTGKPQHDADLRVARKQSLYPSYTTVDKDIFKNDFLDKWKLNQVVIAAGENPRQPHEDAKQYAQRIYDLSLEKGRNAAAFGNEIHEACEHYPQMPLDARLLPWFLKFEEWYKENVAEDIFTEKVVLDHSIGLAGRADRKVVMKSGRTAIIDYKTQDVKTDDKERKKPVFYDPWPRQLAGYAVAIAREIGTFPKLDDCISIIIDSNEGGGIYVRQWSEEELREAYRTFVHGAWLWFDKRNYWPCGLWYPEPVENARLVESLKQ